MTDEDFMKLAIDEADKAALAGLLPLGVVIIKNKELIVSAHAQTQVKMDPSAHGEIECIRDACRKLTTTDLSGCTLYTVVEPCSMCLGCAGWCGLSRIIFGAYQEDVSENPYELMNYHAEGHAQRMNAWGGTKLIVHGGVLREECIALMKNIKIGHWFNKGLTHEKIIPYIKRCWKIYGKRLGEIFIKLP